MKTALPILLVLSACAFIINAHPHVDDGSPLSVLPMLFGGTGGGAGGPPPGGAGAEERNKAIKWIVDHTCEKTVGMWQTKGPSFLSGLEDEKVIDYCKIALDFFLPMRVLNAKYVMWASDNNVQAYGAYAVKVRDACRAAVTVSKAELAEQQEGAKSVKNLLLAAADVITEIDQIKNNADLNQAQRIGRIFGKCSSDWYASVVAFMFYGQARYLPTLPPTTTTVAP